MDWQLTTDDNGKFQMVIPRRTLETGRYKLTASFSGDNYYTSASAEKNIQIMENITTFSLSLTGTQVISSGDSTTITATLLGDDDPFNDAVLDYKIKHGNTTISTGTTSATDANGQTTISYTGTGAGDIDITVSYGSYIQETFVVEDCYRYDTTVHNTNTVLNYSLPPEFELQFTLHSVSTVSGNTCYLRFNNSNTIFIGKATSSNRNVYFYDGSDHLLGTTVPESTDYTLTLTYENGVATLTDGVNTLSLSVASLTSIYNVNVGRQDNYVKNIKIKAL